jgi:SNF2 family DNA or RNA helicase
MLIHPKKPFVALNLRNPTQVLNTIPTAKLKEYKGRPFVVVPHRVDETVVLRRLGVKVPSPILYRYDWRGAPHKPAMSHQKETAAFLTMHRRAFVFNGLGSGKSLAALHAAEFLRSEGKVKRTLIVCPLSTMQRAWGDEIFENFMHRRYVILHGSREKRLALLAQEADYYIVNHDGISLAWLQQAIMHREDINLIIADEASAYRNSRTTRYKRFETLINRPGVRTWLMTATPCPNAPTDAWALARLVDKTTVPKYFKSFQERVMHQISPYKWVPRSDGARVAFEVMQPAIRFATRDCIDLPPTTYMTRSAELTPEQQKAYQQMHRTFVMQAAKEKGKPVVAANAAVKLSKLIQIACGAVRTGDGDDTVELDAAPRIQVVKEIIEEAGGKVIVFVPFKAVLQKLALAISEEHTVAIVSGDTSVAERNRIFAEFQSPAELRVLVAHPKCMSHGLTLTAADTIVWYAPYPSNEVTEQANGRIVRTGQTRHTNIVEIEATPVEHEIYKALRTRKKMSETIMELYKNEFGN